MGLPSYWRFTSNFSPDFAGCSEVHAELVVRSSNVASLPFTRALETVRSAQSKSRCVRPSRSDGECVRHFAHHFALIEIKAQGNAHILKVVVAAGGVGPVRARSRREQRSDGENGRRQ